MCKCICELPKVIVFMHGTKKIIIIKENEEKIVEKLKQTVKKQFDRTVPNTNTKPILAAACMHSSTWCSLFSNTFFFSFHLFGLLLFLSGFFFLLIHRCVSECACVCVSEVFFVCYSCCA